MPIDLRAHRELIRKHADVVEHWQGFPCSCAGNPGQANPRCQVCFGKGYFWRDPQKMHAVIVGMHSDQAGKFWLQHGLALPEDLLCMQLPNAPRRLVDGDLLIPQWPQGFPFQGEVLQRTTDLTAGGDRLTYRAMNGLLDAIFMVDPLGGTQLDYVAGIDYTLDPANWQQILWLPNRGPGDGQYYTVRYHARFEFVAFNPPSQRFEKGHDLGQRALLRKRHLPWPSFSL